MALSCRRFGLVRYNPTQRGCHGDERGAEAIGMLGETVDNAFFPPALRAEGGAWPRGPAGRWQESYPVGWQPTYVERDRAGATLRRPAVGRSRAAPHRGTLLASLSRD